MYFSKKKSVSSLVAFRFRVVVDAEFCCISSSRQQLVKENPEWHNKSDGEVNRKARNDQNQNQQSTIEEGRLHLRTKGDNFNGKQTNTFLSDAEANSFAREPDQD